LEFVYQNKTKKLSRRIYICKVNR